MDAASKLPAGVLRGATFQQTDMDMVTGEMLIVAEVEVSGSGDAQPVGRSITFPRVLLK